MDRQLIYPGAIPLDTDLLNTNKNALLGDGAILAALFDTPLKFRGLTVGPTVPASMAAIVQPGVIYEKTTVDATAYGSLPADASTLYKAALQGTAVTLALTPPTTAGQSITYLIQAQLTDTDTNPAVLQYYNAAQPNQPFSGPGNNQAAQPTVRKEVVSITAKPGISAATGTQQPPALDANNVPLGYVTLAYGDIAAQPAAFSPIPSVLGAPFVVSSLDYLAASPFFTGAPRVNTPPFADSSTLIPNTAFVQGLMATALAEALAQAEAVLTTPPGVVTAYAGAVAPSGWLMCDGRALSRVTYANLFSVIGGQYGAGDGVNNFNIPDLRGEFVRGNDNGRGIDPSRVLGSLQVGTVGPHQHLFPSDDMLGQLGNQLAQPYVDGGPGFQYDADSEFRGNGRQLITHEVPGAPLGTETRPANISLNYIIKI